MELHITLHRYENCSITFKPLLSLLFFLLVLTTFADIETVTDRITRTVAPKTELV